LHYEVHLKVFIGLKVCFDIRAMEADVALARRL